MDLLSRLLALAPVSGRLEVRCQFGAPWRLEQAQSGAREIPYHVLLRGSAIVEDGSAAPAALRAGDVVLFPHGGRHAVHDGSGKKPRPVQERASTVVTIAQNAGKGAPADLLCGRFYLSSVSERLLRDFLPYRLIVRSQPFDATSDDISGTRLARLIELMREEAVEEGPGSATLISHLSAALFALTLRFAGEGVEAPRGLLALGQRTRLQPAVLSMFDAPERPWTLPELAALCHMSRATLVRQFQEAIGRSPSDMLTEIRMTHAARRLAQTEQSVAAVGESVGYLSEAAFQRAFKRHAGLSPARWRATHTAGP
jgi:AraC family transcriptional activator of mtrCDE